MKLFYITLLFFSLITSVFSQVVTFPDSNATWVNGDYNWDQHHLNYDHSITTYCMGKEDTIIGSFTYSKINYCDGNYKGATRTESGKVYYVPKDSTTYYLLYDFTKQEGDMLYNLYADYIGVYSSPITVGYVDEITISGIVHKRMQVGGVIWIEGIGNVSRGLFQGVETLESFYYTKLDCMSQNDTTLYPDFSLHSCKLTLGNTHAEEDKSLLVYPNPAYQSVSVQWDEAWKGATLIVYNSAGQMMHPVIHTSDKQAEIDLSHYPEGLYSIVMNTEQKSYTAKIMKQ